MRVDRITVADSNKEAYADLIFEKPISNKNAYYNL